MSLSEGPFTYTTTFSLRTGIDLAATTLSVSYASDNATDSITLNGTEVPGVSGGSYSSFVVLPITGPFVVGTNTHLVRLVELGRSDRVPRRARL